MSQAQIDGHTRFAAAYDARDPDSVADLLSPDLHIDATTMAMTGHNRTFTGMAGLREWVADTFAPFDEASRYEIVDIVAVGKDFAVKSERVVGHGARSGAPLELAWISVSWATQDGKLVHAAGYASRREALEAVGLGG